MELADRLLPQERHVLHLRCADSGAEVPGSPIILEDAPPAPARERPAGPEVNAGGMAVAGTGPPVVDEAAFAPAAQPVGDRADRSAITHRVAPQAALRAYIDELSDTDVRGWVMRPDQPSHRCLVALKEGDRVLARAVASRFRADLVPAGIGDGCHCFALPMPRSVLDGEEHLLDIVEEDTGIPLTAKPIRWRSGAAAGQNAFSSAADRMGAMRLFDLASGLGADAERPPIAARADYGALASSAPEIHQLRQLRTHPRPVPVVGTRVLFDISDLVYYIGEHANLTGIQRVQSSIVLAILASEVLPRSQLIFLSYNAKTRDWVSIPTGLLATLLQDLFLPESQRLVSFPAEEARYGLLPGAQKFDGFGVLDDGNPSVLCLLGAAWVHQDYIHRVLALKRQFGTRFVMTVHDLIPIYARETCDQDTARVFEEFMRRALRHADHILSVSENTAKDLRRYAQSLQISEPSITVTRNGSSFAEFLPKGTQAGELQVSELPQRFVLFVGTIEGRKNHQLMLDIWRRMIDDGDDPPHLVCVGRLGWKSSAFISTLVETGYLGGRILLLRDICDADLRLLYSRCLFTVCPTFYEGWGLPIGESLAMGKICVSSDRASVPEVAGDFGVYLDIADFEQSLKVVRDLISDAAARRRLEQKIRRGYAPITWRSVAEKVVTACLATPKTEWQEPYPYTEIPYSSEVSFGRLDRDADGTGEALLARIEGTRRGLYLSEPLHEQSFVRGEEARSAGYWAYPEEWGTWACHAGGEVALGLAPNESRLYYVFLRVRVSGPLVEQPIRLTANGERVWDGAVGPRPRDIVLRIRRKAVGAGGWRLRIRAQIDLTAETRSQIAALDSRMPTIGFERLIVVPENDLKTRVDILYTLLL